MRVTIRWVKRDGTSGRAPGKWATVSEAEQAARDLMSRYPSVVTVDIYHATFGHVADVVR